MNTDSRVNIDRVNEVDAVEAEVSKSEIDLDSVESRGVKAVPLSEEELDALEWSYVDDEPCEKVTADMELLGSDLKNLSDEIHRFEKKGDDRGGDRPEEESSVSGFIAVNPEISRCIRDCRRRLGMTQSALADKVSALLRESGGDSPERAVSVLTVSRLERGAVTRVHAQLLQSIETVLGMERQTLMSMESVPAVPAGVMDGLPVPGGSPLYDGGSAPSTPEGTLGVSGIDANEIRFCFHCGAKLIVPGCNFCQRCGSRMPTVVK